MTSGQPQRPRYTARRAGSGLAASLLLLLVVAWPLASAGAAGSWVASVPGMMVAMSDRPVAAQAAVPPAGAPTAGRTMARVQWRYTLPPGRTVDAWLCHPAGCTALEGQRGSTEAFAGHGAGAPLRFHFRLPVAARPLRVEGMQVIVNYR